MTNDKVIELLQQYPFLKDDYRRIQQDLKKYIELQDNVRQTLLQAQKLSDMPAGQRTSNQTLDAVIKLIDTHQANIDYCLEQIYEINKCKKWIDKAFETLTEREKRIVILKYINQMSNKGIAYTIDLPRNTVSNLLLEIINKIKTIIN